MARIRTIKPDFCTSKDVGALSRDARLFFLQLLTECDDEGRLLWIPRRLSGVLYPFDEDVTAELLEQWADECSARNMVTIYEADGVKALQINNWSKHQKISHPSPSRIGAPPESLRNESGNAQEPLRPDLGKGKGKEQGRLDPRDPLEGFEGFWRLWPKKVAKEDAVKAWRKLKPDAATVVLIIGAVAKQARSRDWLKDSGQFIPYPATWLNGRRWEDAPLPAGGSDGVPTLSAAEIAP